MSDGIAKHDWRQLRDKLQKDIETHRYGQEIKARRAYAFGFALHYENNGKSLCGHTSRYVKNVTDNINAVDCNRCRNRMSVLRITHD